MEYPEMTLPPTKRGRPRKHVLLMQCAFCYVNSGTGIAVFLTVFPDSKPGIIFIFVCDGTVVDFLVTVTVDVRSLIKYGAAFTLKIGAGLVTGGAGSAFDTADENLPTGIGLFAAISMDTEVLCIVKSALMIPVRQAMCLDFFRYASRIFTQVFGNVLEGTAFIQRVFNVYTVLKGKVFLVTRNITAHKISSYCC